MNEDTLFIPETKVGHFFPSVRFKIFGFSMCYGYDRDSIFGRLLFYIRTVISAKFLKHDFAT